MKTRALGLFLMVAGACAYSAGCSSSGGNGGTGGKGTGGAGTAGAPGTGGAGTGGRAGAPGTGGATDAGTDVPSDVPTDRILDAGGPTFTDVYAILSNATTETSPGCVACHDGINPTPDAGAPTAPPHSLDFRTKATAYAALMQNSTFCTLVDGGLANDGGAVKRVVAGSPDSSPLVSKLRAAPAFGGPPACGGSRAMPFNRPVPDGGADGGTLTHYMINQGQLNTIIGWIAAGALDN